MEWFGLLMLEIFVVSLWLISVLIPAKPENTLKLRSSDNSLQCDHTKDDAYHCPKCWKEPEA